MSRSRITHRRVDKSQTTPERATLTEAAGIRVRMLTLHPGQNVPWHFHSEITDTFFCLEGDLVVTTRKPNQRHVLAPGSTCVIPAGVAHHVEGVGGKYSRFIIIQGVGVYDYISVAG